LRGSAVELLSWSGLDQGPRGEPRPTVVLRDVAALSLNYVDRSGARHAVWPPADASDGDVEIPAGVEVGLTLSSGERITRLLPTAVRPGP
jgi:hypothetical protein